MRTHLMMTGILCGLAMTVTGCSSPHYRVNDPASGKKYYTTKIDDAGRAGAVKFKDGKSGSTVTLQSSEVTKISSDEYDAGLAQPAALPEVKKGSETLQKETIQKETIQTVPVK